MINIRFIIFINIAKFYRFRKHILKELILLIRFKDITSKDFRCKIMPYQKLFPKVLWETILDYYLVADNRSLSLLSSRRLFPKPDLTIIINKKLLLLFASWINKKDPSYNLLKDVRHQFKLLFHSIRDVLNTVKFHQK